MAEWASSTTTPRTRSLTSAAVGRMPRRSSRATMIRATRFFRARASRSDEWPTSGRLDEAAGVSGRPGGVLHESEQVPLQVATGADLARHGGGHGAGAQDNDVLRRSGGPYAVQGDAGKEHQAAGQNHVQEEHAMADQETGNQVIEHAQQQRCRAQGLPHAQAPVLREAAGRGGVEIVQIEAGLKDNHHHQQLPGEMRHAGAGLEFGSVVPEAQPDREEQRERDQHGLQPHQQERLGRYVLVEEPDHVRRHARRRDKTVGYPMA